MRTLNILILYGTNKLNKNVQNSLCDFPFNSITDLTKQMILTNLNFNY